MQQKIECKPITFDRELHFARHLQAQLDVYDNREVPMTAAELTTLIDTKNLVEIMRLALKQLKSPPLAEWVD